ncbi:MAG: hemolysin III family protein [Erysipelotrichales bacterium]|nr:hemolysin III family protein [Erysipelotrichales bacterium]
MKLYTLGEEIFNSVSHGIGVLLAIIGTYFLISKAIPIHNIQTTLSVIVYGLSLITLYLLSCLYHAITNMKLKAIFRIFDHSGIFILIVGSYMPFLLVTLEDYQYAKYIAVLLWICAIVGIILNFISLKKFEKLSMVLYVVMGWSAVLVLKDIVVRLPFNGLLLLVLGGLMYTVGIFFYKANHVRYMHSIWHLFVLAGSLLHYFCIVFFVL